MKITVHHLVKSLTEKYGEVADEVNQQHSAISTMGNLHVLKKVWLHENMHANKVYYKPVAEIDVENFLLDDAINYVFQKTNNIDNIDNNWCCDIERGDIAFQTQCRSTSCGDVFVVTGTTEGDKLFAITHHGYVEF